MITIKTEWIGDILLRFHFKKESAFELNFISLKTNIEHLSGKKDERTGLIITTTTHELVYMYVDARTNDTIYVATGKVINE